MKSSTKSHTQDATVTKTLTVMIQHVYNHTYGTYASLIMCRTVTHYLYIIDVTCHKPVKSGLPFKANRTRVAVIVAVAGDSGLKIISPANV